MYCSECGEKIDGMNFCPNCGHMVTEAEKKAADFAGKAEEKKTIEESAAPEAEKKLSKAVMATARRNRKGKKKIIFTVSGILALAVLLVFLFTRREPVSVMGFEFCGYEVALPDTYAYAEEKSSDRYAVFYDKNGGDSRIDLYYAGKSLIEETGMSSVDLISILYDKYQIPSNVQMGAVQVEEADSITGMYTISGKLLVPGDNSPWTVYACINRDDDLFYFVLQDDLDEAVDDFEEAIYQTKLI